MVGEVVGSYRIVRKLGEGGMGEVWLAEHLLLGQKVAIKFLQADVTKHEGIVRRFFDEARAASQIADPGIVAVHDFGWHARGAYIIMEFLAGESLGARLRAERPPVAHALRIAQQVALTMAVAHGRGIIHRDLKPDNIVLVPDAAMPTGERTKVLDFGIAKLISDDGTSHTRTDIVMGSPSYMSPEQCRGAAGVDHRTDIYALGCILFRMLCGRLPFIDPTPGDMIASHITSPPPIPSSIEPSLSPALDAIVARCLAKEPRDRFETMTELARALADAAGTPLDVATIAPVRASGRRVAPAKEPTATTLGSSAAESIAVPRRNRRIVAVAAVIAAAVVIATLVVLARPGGRRQAAAGGESGAIDANVPREAIDSALDAPAPADAAPSDAALPDAGRPKRPPHGSNQLYQNR